MVQPQGLTVGLVQPAEGPQIHNQKKVTAGVLLLACSGLVPVVRLEHDQVRYGFGVLRRAVIVGSVLLFLLGGCVYPSKSFFGYSFHAASLDGDYQCRFVGVSSLFDGEELHDPRYVDAPNNSFPGWIVISHPGPSQTGALLEVKLECFDEDEQLLGTSVYRGALINGRVSSTMVVQNFLPALFDSGDCVAPSAHDGGFEFCVVLDGFRRVP